MARALYARRDPAWTADGFVSERWMPISPVTGRLDAFEWKDPLSGYDGNRPMIEASDRDDTVSLPPPAERPNPDVPLDLSPVEKSAPVLPRSNEPVVEPPPATALRTRATRPEPPVSGPPAVIPLVHAPDDPGPDLETPAEPVPESEAKPDVWGRLRQYFKA